MNGQFNAEGVVRRLQQLGSSLEGSHVALKEGCALGLKGGWLCLAALQEQLAAVAQSPDRATAKPPQCRPQAVGGQE